MRGKKAPKRTVAPDTKFNRIDITKLINRIMQDGKKTVAQKIVYDAFEQISAALKKDPLEIYDEAMRNLGPNVEVKGRRIGGSNYQVPIVVIGERKLNLAHKWLIEAASRRKGKRMATKLAEEIMAITKGEGEAMKKREDVQRMAEANKAFAHFA